MTTARTHLLLALLVSLVGAIHGQSLLAGESPRRSEPFNTLEMWKRLEAREGQEKSTLRLEAVISPERVVLGKPWRLVLSIKNIGDQPAQTYKKLSDGDYEVLLRAANGTFVPPTEAGRKRSPFDQSSFFRHIIAPGYAVGASLPMHDLYDIRESGEYELLASVLLTGEVGGTLVSKKVKVVVHKGE